ncbi:MAG: hypothetical protein RMI94_00675 [Bryobacterales bacterium]|nr:hypothetical protein [Bryobacterales bacterium]
MHLLLMYTGTERFQGMDVNLDTGGSRLVDLAPGGPGPNGAILHSNGKLYIGSGHLTEYDPDTGEVRLVARLAESTQYAIEGDDGAVYLGECVRGYVERYDPATGVFENFGIMDDPGPPYYRYAYTLGADRRYVYVAMGQMPWYLVVYDRQTRRQRVYWKDAGASYVGVSRGTGGAWFAQGPGGAWHRLTDGEPVPLARGERPQLDPYPRGLVADITGAVARKEFGYDVDLSEVTPDTATGGLAIVRWRRPGEAEWRTAWARPRMSAEVVHRLYRFSESELLAIPFGYGPLVLYDTVTGRVRGLGRTQRSLYAALPVEGEWFLAGYPAATLRWDPSKPWTLTYSTPNPSDPRVNPYMLPGFHKYHYYLARGADGFVYVGVHHERDSVGGQLGWYDPLTGARGSLREPFEKFDVRDLIAADGGRKLVYSAIALEPELEGRLFVYDVASRRIEREIVPVAGLSATDKLVEVEPGVVLGILGTRFFRCDVRTGEVHWVQDLGGQAFDDMRSYNRRPILGPDGWVWLYVGRTICRIEPRTGVIERILDAPPARNLLFMDGDLYLYGTTSLARIRGLLRLPEGESSEASRGPWR